MTWKRSNRKGWTRMLDKLCREVTLLRDESCRAPTLVTEAVAMDPDFEPIPIIGTTCRKVTRLQWCHIRSRRYHSTRWAMQNVLMMCSGHHLWAHHNPHLFSKWFEEAYPERHAWLMMASRHPHKVDYELISFELIALKEGGAAGRTRGRPGGGSGGPAPPLI